MIFPLLSIVWVRWILAFIYLRDWVATVCHAVAALFYPLIIWVAGAMFSWHHKEMLSGFDYEMHNRKCVFWLRVTERHRQKLTSCRAFLRNDDNAQFVLWLLGILNRLTGGGA